MKTLTQQLSQYASYHRDGRNIATHFVGVPMIVTAVAVLLSRPAVELGGLTVSPAIVLGLAAGIYYLLLDLGLGLAMDALLAGALYFGAWCAQQSTTLWLATGLGLFTIGWIFQFVGHHFEGRKPAFVDDLIGLMIGPLFVLAELLFMLGLLRELQRVVQPQRG